VASVRDIESHKVVAAIQQKARVVSHVRNDDICREEVAWEVFVDHVGVVIDSIASRPDGQIAAVTYGSRGVVESPADVQDAAGGDISVAGVLADVHALDCV